MILKVLTSWKPRFVKLDKLPRTNFDTFKDALLTVFQVSVSVVILCLISNFVRCSNLQIQLLDTFR